MVYLEVYSALILLLALFSQLSESRLTQETLQTTFETSSKSNKDEGTKWALLVAGSNGYGNYRHQADVCHAYQILKKGGFKDENIVVFMYDDIAYDDDNPRKGIIINSPNGSDVYKGVPKDYTGKNVTKSNLFAAILGDKDATKGGSGKVIDSGPNDHIFIYYSDHGSPGFLTMPIPYEYILAKELIDTLEKKHKLGTYKSMVLYIEACEAGSIFEGLTKDEWNIYVTTASNSQESSWATYCSSEFSTCLGDLYSVAWLEDCETHDTQLETLEQQYQVVKERTLAGGIQGSHVMQYGNHNKSNDLLSLYLGSFKHLKGGNHKPQFPSSPIVEQHEADIFYLKQKVFKAPDGSLKRKRALQKLQDALSHRQHVDHMFKEIEKSIFGLGKGIEMNKFVRSKGKPIVDDWECFKAMVATYESHCGALSTYGKKNTRAFANMCNAGIQPSQLAKIASHLCEN